MTYHDKWKNKCFLFNRLVLKPPSQLWICWSNKNMGKWSSRVAHFELGLFQLFFKTHPTIHTTSGYRTLSRIMQSNTSKKTRAQVAKQKSDLHQILATSHESEEGNWDPSFQRNLGWWNIIIWPAHLSQSVKERLPGNCAGDFLGRWVHVTLSKTSD